MSFLVSGRKRIEAQLVELEEELARGWVVPVPPVGDYGGNKIYTPNKKEPPNLIETGGSFLLDIFF